VKNKMVILALVACGVASSQNTHVWKLAFQPFTGIYSVYGGGLGDPYAPTQGDRHMSFSIGGPIAKEMFAAMGPDLKGVCGTENGGRIRQRAEVSCSFDSKDGYQCDFGFDLTSGRSIGGSIC
jgi:hypothetical protein